MERSIRSRLDHVLDLLVDAVCVVDIEGRFVFVSAAGERIFGYTPDEMLGRPMIELVHPDDRTRTLEAAATIMAGTPSPHFENRYLRKDGQIVHIMWSARWSEADRLRIAVARDITGRKRAEMLQAALLAISEAAHTAADLLALFRRIHEIIGGLLPARNFFVALYDAETDMLSFPYFVDEHDAAPAPMRLDSGTLSAEVIRNGEALLLTPGADAALPDRVGPIVGRESLDWLGVPLIAQKGILGALVVQSYSGDTRYTDKDKQLLQFVSTQVAAAVERKQTETWLRHIAQHDVLTALPNRQLFDDRLQTALARAQREHERLALLYIDLDTFKQVNDTLGHGVGDRLLHEVARRISGCVRESDTVGRMSGDEFVVLLIGIQQTPHALIVAEKIRSALQQPFVLDGHSMRVTASIGVAVYPEHGGEGQRLVREADHAMYVAKKQGGDRCLLANPRVDG
ncbi:MAG: diguanylate cyclase [Xanthomonadaceae bacterium]|nr:diguanylate cyclase [Xanthomonadaceae bacterium]MDE1958361.1 diguanylate cyclase [Xanthomonadaceae bacterium]MDE2178089.1 diguanylate cyclase [Xanthomonadaceae bacterium]MDE2246831.1 diguanylate cyclase [Xanthomonadaceae bacterium]